MLIAQYICHIIYQSPNFFIFWIVQTHFKVINVQIESFCLLFFSICWNGTYVLRGNLLSAWFHAKTGKNILTLSFFLKLSSLQIHSLLWMLSQLHLEIIIKFHLNLFDGTIHFLLLTGDERVKSVLYHVFSPCPIENFWYMWPFLTLGTDLTDDNKVLLSSPLLSFDVGVEMVQPSFPDIGTCSEKFFFWAAE